MPAKPGDSYFVDTNVLLYSLDARNPQKRLQAAAWMDSLWASGAGRLSWQVLNEFYANAIRKLGTAHDDARRAVSLLSKWRPGGVSFDLVERAWHWMDQTHLTYWDAMILASAERQGCSVLLSEDFQIGRSYGTVRTVNPFLEEPPAASRQAGSRRDQ
jgi:predicted nucleic acid-binding protein